MKVKWILRVAALAVLFFAVGHSVGHFTRKANTDPQAVAVYQAMEGYKFPIGPQMRSYDEFYEGMSLNLIVTLLAFTVLLWILSGVASRNSEISRQILWPIVLCLAAFAATSWVYFFIVPAITCVIASLLVLVAILLLKKEGSSRTA